MVPVVPEVAATGGVIEAAEGTTAWWAEVRALRFAEPKSTVTVAVAGGAGAFARDEGAGPRAAAPDGAVRRVESLDRWVFEPCDVEAPLDESALLDESAPAMPSPWGPANASPVTNVAAPNRAVNRVARRLLRVLSTPDIGSP